MTTETPKKTKTTTRKTTRVSLELHPAKQIAWQAYADEAHISLSEWIRRACDAYVEALPWYIREEVFEAIAAQLKGQTELLEDIRDGLN